MIYMNKNGKMKKILSSVILGLLLVSASLVAEVMDEKPVRQDIALNLPPSPEVTVGSENLIANSGFEKTVDSGIIAKISPKWRIVSSTLPVGWDFNGDQTGIATLICNEKQARSGTCCLKIEKEDNYRSAAIHTPHSSIINVVPDDIFLTSVWVRGEGEINVFVYELTDTEYIYARPLISGQKLCGEWYRLDLEYTVPEQSIGGKKVARIRFGIHLAPKGTLYIDDFEVIKSPKIKILKTDKVSLK